MSEIYKNNNLYNSSKTLHNNINIKKNKLINNSSKNHNIQSHNQNNKNNQDNNIGNTFKISKREFISDNRSTLLDLHEKKLKEYEKENNLLDELEKKLKEYNLLLKEVTNNQEKSVIQENILNLEDKIDLIKNDTRRINYLLDFIPFARKIQETFNNENNNSSKTLHNDNNINNIIDNKKGILDNFVNSKVDNFKINLFNEYINKFSPEGVSLIPVSNYNEKKCNNCKNNNFIVDYRQSCEICNKCGKSEYLLELPISNQNTYIEGVEKQNHFEYKRKNHLIECLNQLQAKENTKIPKKILDDLVFELKKYNIYESKLLTPKLIKQYLKKLNYSKYYEHVPVIINEICGKSAPKLTQELEEQIKSMFDQIQSSFDKHSEIVNSKRKNFLNYNYIIYKFCELLGKREYLYLFPLLKSREKLYEHDQIWKGICGDLGWTFIPSI